MLLSYGRHNPTLQEVETLRVLMKPQFHKGFDYKRHHHFLLSKFSFQYGEKNQETSVLKEKV